MSSLKQLATFHVSEKCYILMLH